MRGKSRIAGVLAMITLAGCASIVVLSLSGCAVGAATAATAGYALKAKTAEELSTEGESRIVEQAKKEMITELQAKGLIKNTTPAK